MKLSNLNKSTKQLLEEALLREMPHTRFDRDLPTEFSFLNSGEIADLGFENLGLEDEEQLGLIRAFGAKGVRVPGTDFVLRYSGKLLKSVIERAGDGDYLSLPEHWRQGVLVIGSDDVPTWIGRRVRAEHLPASLDMSAYEEQGDGWLLRV